MADMCMRVFVEGRVQGVWFRGSTQEKALSLGIGGWVRNLSDGRVEVLMCGPRAAVAELELWLHNGPRMARVDRVIATEEPVQSFTGFTTR